MTPGWKTARRDSACRESRSEGARRYRDEWFTTPGGIHVRTNERTFLQFLSSHCLTPSSWVRTSGASKNLALGPPSFFGPNDSIFHRFSTTKRNDPDHEATRRAQTWHASEVGCECTGRTSIAARNTALSTVARGVNHARRDSVNWRAMTWLVCSTNANPNKYGKILTRETPRLTNAS